MSDAGQDQALEVFEDHLEPLALRRRDLGQACPDLARLHPREDGPLANRVEVVSDPVDGAMRRGAELIGVDVPQRSGEHLRQTHAGSSNMIS